MAYDWSMMRAVGVCVGVWLVACSTSTTSDSGSTTIDSGSTTVDSGTIDAGECGPLPSNPTCPGGLYPECRTNVSICYTACGHVLSEDCIDQCYGCEYCAQCDPRTRTWIQWVLDYCVFPAMCPDASMPDAP